MKVLWLSPTPCNAFSGEMTSQGGGWMISLEHEMKLQQSIELEVAFLYNMEIPPFTNDNVKYYPVCVKEKAIALKRIYDRFFENQSKEDDLIIKLLNGIIKESKPDLIHVHGTEGFGGLVYRTNPQIPVAYSIQGLLAPCIEKFYSGIPASFISVHEPVLERVRGLSSSLKFKKMGHKAKRELNYLKNAQYIIGRTNWDRRIPLLCNPAMQYFTGDEILRGSFYRAQWNKKAFEERLRIVSTISADSSYKGFETLIHAAFLLKTYADFDFEWHVIGYTKKTKWVDISEKYKGISCKDVNVHLLGRKNADEMVDVLLKNDIYCHVSHIENSPNSVCEAMLLGMPVVATSGGGTCSMLENEKEGILVQDGDPYAMAGTIVDLHQHFDKAKEMGLMARRRALVRHNPKRIGDTLVGTYKTIIEDFANNVQ